MKGKGHARMTQAEFERYNAKMAGKALDAPVVTAEPSKPVAKIRREPQPNKTEARFAEHWKRVRAAELAFQPITLRFGGVRYTPDFVHYRGCGEYELTGLVFLEVKGRHIWDDAKVKFSMFKTAFPQFEFQMWQEREGIWTQIR